MNRIALFIFVFLWPAAGLAQAQAQEALNAINSGKSDVALTLLDQVKGNLDSRGEYAYCKAYAALFEQSSDGQDFRNAVDHCNKAVKTGSPIPWAEKAQTQLTIMWTDAINRGAEHYAQRDMGMACDEFLLAGYARPEDTTAFLYLGVAAQASDEPHIALAAFTKLMELGYDSDPNIYTALVFYAKSAGDTTLALTAATKGMALFPQNRRLPRERIELLIKSGQLKRARGELERAIDKEPDNANLWFNLGFLNEQLGMTSEALANYGKALKLDPDYFDAAYNLGVYHFNQAADLYEELTAAAPQDLSPDEAAQREKELQAQARNQLREALPYMKQSSELKQNDPGLLDVLAIIYRRLGMEEEAQQAAARSNELRGR